MSPAITRSTIAAGLLALTLGGAVGVAPAPASAATTQTLVLRSTRMAVNALGRALITRTSAGDYRVTISATGLPAPAAVVIPHGKTRHVYVAWVSQTLPVRGRMMGMMEKITLRAGGPGSYRGSAVVMVSHVAFVFVSAEGSAAVRQPAVPYGGVLLGAMMR